MVIHYFIGITRDISSQFREAEARRRERKGWLGGCRCTLRCAVSITHPSAVSTSPNRRFCRRTNHFSCSNLFRPLSTPFDPYHRSPFIPIRALSVSRIRVYAPGNFRSFPWPLFSLRVPFSHPRFASAPLVTLFFRSRRTSAARDLVLEQAV